ncbi:MAG: riboflavin synthase [Bacteroidota bacterium]
MIKAKSMFTGLIEEVGTISKIEQKGSGLTLSIKCKNVMSDLSIDDSISVNGACQTVIAVHSEEFRVDSVRETLLKTTLGSLKVGDAINLERALQLSDRLGGHIVQGHVDCVGHVHEIKTVSGGGWELWITFPDQYKKYVVPVGSICINGVSLTVARIHNNTCMLAIIPHTLAVTTIGKLTVNAQVNIEFDILAKYVENMVALKQQTSSAYDSLMDQPNL